MQQSDTPENLLSRPFSDFAETRRQLLVFGDSAVRPVVSDNQPRHRSYAAGALARIGDRCAVPGLIGVIGDTAEYAQDTYTDPFRVEPVTVSSAAIAALERLTGVRRSRTRSKTTTSYESWWQRNRDSLGCK